MKKNKSHNFDWVKTNFEVPLDIISPEICKDFGVIKVSEVGKLFMMYSGTDFDQKLEKYIKQAIQENKINKNGVVFKL